MSIHRRTGRLWRSKTVKVHFSTFGALRRSEVAQSENVAVDRRLWGVIGPEMRFWRKSALLGLTLRKVGPRGPDR